MATRINFKFIATLIMAVIAAAGIIALLWYLQTRGDAAQHAELGDARFAEGEYRSAVQSYRRAVGREPANKEYLRKMEQALLQIRPETISEARERYQEWLSILRHDVNYDQANPDTHLRLIREIHSNARFMAGIGQTDQRTFWEQLESAAGDMLIRVSETEEKYDLARVYRSIARVALRHRMSDRDLEEALEDLVAFVEANPEHDLANASLITGERLIARRIAVRGTDPRAEERRQRIEQHIERAFENVPDGPEVQLAYARYLADLRSSDPGAVSRDDFDAALDKMVRAAQDSGDSSLVLEAAALLGRAGIPDGAEFAASLIEWQLRVDPELLAHKLMLVQFKRQANDLVEARRIAQELVDAEPVSVRFIAHMQYTIRQLAASFIVDIQFDQWRVAVDPDEDDRRSLAALREAREQLAGLSADPDNDPTVLRADAKIALAEGRHDRAASLFERLIQAGFAEMDMLVYSAYCLGEIGEVGLAHQRLTEAMQHRQEPNPAMLTYKAEIEQSMGRFEDALETAREILRINPEDETALRIARAAEAGIRSEHEIDSDDPLAHTLQVTEAALRRGDIETARGAVYAIMGDIESETNLQILTAAAQIELNAGEYEQAQALVNRGLEVAPGNTVFRQFQARLDTGDLIEAAHQYVTESQDDPLEQAIELMLTYRAMAEQQRSAAEELEDSGQHERASEAQDLAERAQARAEEYVEQVRAEAADDSRLIDYEFTQALRSRDWESAASIITRAGEAGIGEAQRATYQGRLALERGNALEAVQYFQRVVDQQSFSSEAWRMLGVAYRQVGNFQEAIRAFNRSYQINPNNRSALRGYLGMLLQVGNHQRALEISRATRGTLGRSPEFRELWLQLEAEHGDFATALARRRMIYQQNAADRQNAIQLALLLAENQPTYEIIFDERGQRRFTDRQWARMSVTEQRNVIREASEQWQRTAQQIANDLIQREGRDLQLAMLTATLHHRKGDYERGERLLQDFIESQDDPEDRMESILALSHYQILAGRLYEALETAHRAMEYQPDDSRQVELFVGNFLSSHNNHREAIPFFEHVLELQPTPHVQMQLVESLINVGELDKAERRLDELEEQRQPDFNMTMLRAAILRDQSNRLFAAGDEFEATSKREEFDQMLKVASEMMPSNPTPHIQRARTHLGDFYRTNRRIHLNNALAALSQADSVRANDHRTRMTRIEVLRAMGNTRGAQNEAQQLIQQNPENMQAQRILIQLHRLENQFDEAIDAAREAARVFPSSSIWPEIIGDLHAEQGQYARAARAYHHAYRIGRSRDMLLKAINTMTIGDEPDYSGVIELLQGESELMERDPVVLAHYARALLRIGRADVGKRSMEQSFRRQRSLIANGEQPPSAINEWFQAFDRYFAELPPQEVESLLFDLTDGDPDPYVKYGMSRYWSRVGRDGRSRAVELLTEVKQQLTPDDRVLGMTARFELAALHFQAGDYETAAAEYRQILSLQPNHAIVMNNLAFLLAEHLNQPENALSYAMGALELAPEHPSVLDTAGWVQFKLGQYDEAERLMRRSLEISESAQTQIHMAQLLLATDRAEAAQARLQRATELNPDPRTREKIDRLTDDIRTSGAVR